MRKVLIGIFVISMAACSLAQAPSDTVVGPSQYALHCTGNLSCSKLGSTVTLNATSGAGTTAITPTAITTGYTVLTGDTAKYLIATPAAGASVAVTLPQAGTTGFTGNFHTEIRNSGSGTVVITPTTSTINGGATLTLLPTNAAFIYSDDTNYFALTVPIATGGTNAQTVDYTPKFEDKSKLVTMNGASLTLTLPSPPWSASWDIDVENLNSTALTVSRNSLTINGGTSNITLPQFGRLRIYTDGTNYFSSIPLAATAPITLTQAANGTTAACATCVTSAASLTSTALVTGAGTQASQTPSATATLDASGNLSLPGTLGVTGHLTFEGVTSAGATGTSKLVFSTSPTLTTPVLGVATATSINKMAITAPNTSSTFAVADGKSAVFSNTLTLAGTDSTTMTFPATSDTVAGLGTAETFTAVQRLTGNVFPVCVSSATNCSSGTWTSTAANTLEVISGLSFTLAANTAQKVPFYCRIAYKQNSAAAPIQWGMQASAAPTSIQAGSNWNTTGGTQSTFELTTPITSTTATAISATGTPGDVTAVRIAVLSGMIDNPSQAANTIDMMVLTQTQADTVSVKNLSYCKIY